MALFVPLYGQAKNFSDPDKKLTFGIYGGFGDAYQSVKGRYTDDGRRVNTEQYFLKSFKAVTKYQFSKKHAVSFDIGFVYDYSVGYRLQSNTQSSGFGISSPNAMTNGYTLWHLAANFYQTLYHFKRLTLAGYAGGGVQLFTAGDYYKTEEIHPQHIGDPNRYVSLPSAVNKHPIIFLNAGLDLGFRLGNRATLTFQTSLAYSTKSFITDIVRIETPNYNHTVSTTINGTNAILSLGYSFRFR